ncbi:MAG: phosphoribosylformylglycinamidine synthase I [Planctomycetota bacterium]
MAKPRVLIVRAPGTNCDVETEYAFELAGAETQRLHVNQIIDHPRLAARFQILGCPGGFSYGDDIAAGRIAAVQWQTRLSDTLAQFRSEDRLVLGICNGFQIMMRLGIFFDEDIDQTPATLTWNRQARFETRWVHLKPESDHCVFLRGISEIYLPMAHAEGRFLMRDATTQQKLKGDSQIALRYCDPQGMTGDTELPFPWNPNGAQWNVAGICDPSGRVFGLMPHPERFLFPMNHPQWTRMASLPEHGDGLKLFRNAVTYFG